MRRKRKWIIIIFLLIFTSLGISGYLLSASNYEIPFWAMGNGALLSGGNYSMGGNSGQPVVGISGGGNYTISSGFWFPIEETTTVEGISIYLPFVQNNKP